MERLTKEDLIAFEEDIKQEFLAAHIHAPVHLSGGNEEDVIGIFQNVKPSDWVFSTHRCHYHALLKGIPKEEVKHQIMEGRSMHISSKEHKFMTSSIVAGCLPIALGVAMANKLEQSEDIVWCFVGDMAAETGIFHECVKYAKCNDLPIKFIIEDNGLSTNSPTQEVWGECKSQIHVEKYHYKRTVPHINAGTFVIFN